ncbi:MAG TPA: T9SS type A sorting domain-containing protein [Bacteroidota bacterium]|nr:T9SS type A sorting domain-containing protein [Bacteroidota bacterium]
MSLRSRLLTLAIAACLTAQISVSQWEPIGPAGSSVADIAVSDTCVIALGKWDMHRSSDGGSTWSPLTPPISTSYEESYSYNGVLVIATGWGLYRSTDHGMTWTQPSMPKKEAAQCVTMSQGVWFASTNSSVLRSIDEGLTWSALPTTDSICYARSMAGLSTGLVGSTINSLFTTGWGKGLWRSTDRGFSWVRADAGIRKLQVTTLHSFTYLWLVGGKFQNRGWLYAGTQDSSVWVTPDHGTTWTKVGPGLEGEYVNAILATGGLFGDTLLAATNNGIFMHTSGDSAWHRSNTGYPVAPVRSLCKYGSTILAGTDIGIYASTDAGLHWKESSSGMNGAYTSKLASNATSLFSGLGCLHRRLFSTGSWDVMVPARTRWGSINDIDAGWGSRVLFVSALDSGYWQSMDNGNSWSFSTGGVKTRWLSITHNTARSRLYAGTVGGVMVSSNSGSTWTKVGGSTFASSEVSLVKTSTTGPITTLFAGASGDLYYSENDGTSWIKRTIPNDYYNEIFPSVEDIIVAGSKWLVLGGSPTSTLYRTSDAGVHWDTLYPGISSPEAITYVAPYLFCMGSSIGVRVSTDFGTTWKSFMPAPQGAYIYTILAVGDTLYAGTNNGVMRCPISKNMTAVGPMGNNTPEMFRLQPNYPNPFNPSTTITYSLAERQQVTLRVYDVLGREVATLVKGEQAAGVHTVEFNAVGSASGMYVYRLEAGGRMLQRTMMLVK